MKKFVALSALSVSNLCALPDNASELVSQTLMGTSLKVLDYKDKQNPEFTEYRRNCQGERSSMV